jgi:hypothetical protein
MYFLCALWSSASCLNPPSARKAGTALFKSYTYYFCSVFVSTLKQRDEKMHKWFNLLTL